MFEGVLIYLCVLRGRSSNCVNKKKKRLAALLAKIPYFFNCSNRFVRSEAVLLHSSLYLYSIRCKMI